MKKGLVIAVAVILVVLIAVCVFFGVKFLSLYRSADDTESTAQKLSVQDYAAQKLPEFDCSYDEAAGALTLSRSASLSYDDACAIGGKVYVDELAPETYLSQVRSISLDVEVQCGSPVNVVLCYRSTDGNPIFTVSSDGSVWSCWE